MSLARPAPLGRRQLKKKGVKGREHKWASGWTPQGLWDCAETLGELGQCFYLCRVPSGQWGTWVVEPE